MTFAKVIGQEKIIKQLLEEATTGRLSHARMLYGKEGTGKMALALALAQYINCKQPTDIDSCGECLPCIKYQKFIHPDLHFVFPIVKEGSKKTVCSDFLVPWRKFLSDSRYINLDRWYKQIGVNNKQGIIYEAESSEILKKINQKSYEADYKVVIIWLPEKMHAACANKLLKILEEPPEKTLFFLLTENVNNILPTVCSRTQLLRIPKIENNAISDYLKKLTSEDNKPLFSEKQVYMATSLSDGSITNALQTIGAEDSLQFNLSNFKSLMRIAYSRKIIDLIAWSESISKIGRERQKNFLDYSCRQVRENFMYNWKYEYLYNITSEEEEFSSKFAKFISSYNVEGLYQEFNRSYNDIQHNGNAKIIFLDLGLQITKIIREAK